MDVSAVFKRELAHRRRVVGNFAREAIWSRA